MNMKKVIKGASDFLFTLPQALTGEHRKDVFRDEIKGVIIDTVLPLDTGKWETGIKIKEWIIVEQYENKEKAREGHKKWVEEVKNGKRDFKDIDMWGLNE